MPRLARGRRPALLGRESLLGVQVRDPLPAAVLEQRRVQEAVADAASPRPLQRRRRDLQTVRQLLGRLRLVRTVVEVGPPPAVRSLQVQKAVRALAMFVLTGVSTLDALARVLLNP